MAKGLHRLGGGHRSYAVSSGGSLFDLTGLDSRFIFGCHRHIFLLPDFPAFPGLGLWYGFVAFERLLSYHTPGLGVGV